MVKMKGFLIALLWLLPLWGHAATIIAELDRNPVTLGDPVTLRLTAEGVVGAEPDFSVLERDFDVGRRSQSNSFSFVNGVSSVRTTWTLVLYPLKTGTINIPPIAFGNDQSQALDLQVTEEPQSASGATPDVFIGLEAEPEQPYVQQQTIIVQRLYHTEPLNSSTLTHPAVESGKGDLRQIGGLHRTQMMHNGRNYNVTERRYALVPQQSGELTIGRTRFDGVIAEPGPNDFDPFGLSGKRTRKLSQPLTLQIRPQPAAFTGRQWLPARSLTLNASWQTPPDQLKAGEPVTLTLGIIADGLAAEQLPGLNIQVPGGIKAYADQPELNNNAGGDGVVGVRQEKWVIVSPYNGEFELPEITLDWWNTQEDRQEIARVDPVTMRFSGGQAAPAGFGEPAPPPAPVPADATDDEAGDGEVADNTASGSGWNWVWGVMILLALWAAMSLLWLARRRRSTRRRGEQGATARTPLANNTALRRLEKACRQNQPQAAHDALLSWAEAELALHPALVSRLRELATPALRKEIDTLNTSLYARSPRGWQGENLWQAVRDFRARRPERQAEDSGLAAMYPD